MKALLVLNLQNDFSDFGNMPITGTDELVPLAQELCSESPLSPTGKNDDDQWKGAIIGSYSLCSG